MVLNSRVAKTSALSSNGFRVLVEVAAVMNQMRLDGRDQLVRVRQDVVVHQDSPRWLLQLCDEASVFVNQHVVGPDPSTLREVADHVPMDGGLIDTSGFRHAAA